MKGFLSALDSSLENIRVRVPVHCLYCEEPRPVCVALSAVPADDVPNALDTAAAKRCPCLLDAVWDTDLGRPVSHRGTQRKRIREALLECGTTPEFEERREALRQRLAELQPRKS